MKASLHLQDTALRYFLVVARYGSISEASAQLNVATSAISRQISNLEEILDTKLFERKPRGVELSSAGEMLAAYARRHALESDRIVSEIQALKGSQKGHVKIACSEGFAMDLVPYTIINFRKTHAGTHFDINVCSPEEVSRRVSHGDADIGITLRLSPAKNIQVVHRQPSPIMAVVNAKHALAVKKSITLTQLQAYPIALPTKDTTVRQLFDICCSRLNLNFEPVLESNNMSTLNRFVSFDGGVHLSGEFSMRHQLKKGELVAIPIRDKGMDIRNIEVQTLSGRTLPEAVKDFLTYMVSQMKQDETNAQKSKRRS